MKKAKIAAPAAFTITKTEPDKMLVFGWSNVAVDADGRQIEDLQGDMIDPEELEKAAYDHVLHFRAAGEKHDPGLRHKGRLVESCVFTKEKQAAIGIPPGIVPEGWWVGYKIDDSDAWAKIKSGEYQSFSIGGKGERTPVEKARRDYDQYPGYNEWLEENLDATIEDRKAAAAHYRENRSGSLAKSYAELRKANPYHDARGRFTSKSGGAGKPAASELESKIFGRSAFSEIAENETVREIVDDGDYETYGIRIQEEDTEIVGEMMSHRSSNWGGDFEDDPERAGQGGELDGVSAIDIDMVKHTPKYGGYSGKVAYLLGTNEWAEDGYDSGEKVMPEPRVLAKLGYKSGKLFVIESVKDGNDGVSKSYADLRKFNPYHDSRGRFTSRNAHTLFSPGNNLAQAKRSIDAENKRRAAEGMDQLVAGAYMTMGRVAYGSALKTYLDEQAKKKDPIQQTAAPYKSGKSVKWGNMSDDEFVRDLEKFMPGINDIATKGWAASHSVSQYKDSSLNGDMVLTDIYKARGFNAMPQMMDKASIKSYIAQNKTPELYRGMGTSSHGQSGAEKMDRFEKDPLHFAGYGVLGNGTYAAETPPNSYRNYGLRVARSYAGRNGGGTQVRMTLKKDAKVAAYTTVRRQQREFLSKLGQAYRSGTIGFDTYKAVNNICMDVGRFGALRGYEAWYDKTGAHSGATRNNPFWVVTNRGALMIQNERYT